MKKFLYGSLMLGAFLLCGDARVLRAQETAQQGPKTTQGEAAASGNPTSPKPAANDESNYKKGMEFYQAGRYKDAVEAFKMSLRFRRNSARTHFNLGLAYYGLNRFSEAIASYKEAIRLMPTWDEPHYRLGWAYYVIGDKPAALEQYKILERRDSELTNTLGKILNIAPKESHKKTAETKEAAASAKPTPTPGANSNAQTQTAATTPPNPSSANNYAPSKNSSVPTRTAEKTAPPPTATPGAVPTKQTSVASETAKTNDVAKPQANAADGLSTPPRATPATESAPPKPAVLPITIIPPKNSTPSDAPPSSIYRIGAGDVLDIRLSNSQSARSTLYTVTDAGTVELPVAGGPVKVAGLTTSEIEEGLAAELQRRAVDEKPDHVSVSVRQFNSHTVILSGLVNFPGPKALRREAVPLYVLMAEVQPRPEAGRAVIMNSAGQSQTADLSDPAAMSVLIHPGDVITISARAAQFYYMGGKVFTPGQKVFQPGISLLQAILAAGGLTNSKTKFVKVAREGADGRLTTTKFALKDIRAGKIPDPRVQPGDRIEVGGK